MNERGVLILTLLTAAASISGVAAFFSPEFLLFPPIIALLACFRFSWRACLQCICISAFFYGSASIHEAGQKSGFDGSESSFTVSMTDAPSVDGARANMIVRTMDGEKLLLQYIFRTEQEKMQFQNDFKSGWICRMKGELKHPQSARNPGAFDYSNYLKSNHIHWILSGSHNPLQTCLKKEPKLIDRLKMFRYEGIQKIASSFPRESRGFVAALIYGDREMIDEDVYEAYTLLSLVHILAISGLHVAFLSGSFYYLLIRTGIPREWSKGLLLILLPVYAILAGGSPSVVRACLMVMVVTCLSLFKRRISPVQALSLIFLTLLFFEPHYLMHVGFQLSFAITFSLLMSKKIVSNAAGAGTRFRNSFVISSICQIASVPILIYHFQQVSSWGFVWNMLYVPLFTIILLPLSILCYGLVAVNAPFREVPIWFLEKLFLWSGSLAEWAASLPVVSLSFAKPPLSFLLILIFSLLALFYWWELGNKAKIWGYAGLAFLLFALLYFHQLFNPAGEVTFIDVGQGDCVLIRHPFGGDVYLIDTGGVLSFDKEKWQERSSDFEPGRDIVVPFLQSKGIRHIDKLILTHDDQDHIGGSVAIMEGLDVKEVIIPKVLGSEFLKSEAIRYARGHDIPIRLLGQGDGWMAGKSVYRVIHPGVHQGDSNESSLVLLAEINGLRWLFTGDIGIEAEKELLAAYPGLQADVIKVGHHGSRHSSSDEFLEQLDANVAVISAGRENRYGHPHEEVLDSLETHKVKVYRTDEMGAISYTYLFGQGTFNATIP
ncbi:MAG: DNA internalization-related competence protein ComEC/Rec2 [Bacillus sp. (in: firmicutes)]